MSSPEELAREKIDPPDVLFASDFVDLAARLGC
jgi:hypothetical protein